ncbi:MAG: DUF4260 domain-containing protein [Bacteroidota bacterium]
MKNTFKLEEAAMLLMGCFAYSQMDKPWWVFFALFLAPDAGMLGYLLNPKTGSITYNFFHHKGIAVLCWVGGIIFNSPNLQIAGIILFAHSSFDRILGYGLKYPDSFQHTHLGMIGQNKK